MDPIYYVPGTILVVVRSGLPITPSRMSLLLQWPQAFQIQVASSAS